jgi:hypothetical protein
LCFKKCFKVFFCIAGHHRGCFMAATCEDGSGLEV